MDGNRWGIGTTCDRRDCPAQARRRVDIRGQDFYFCEHHATEIDAVLSAQDPRQPEAAVPVPA